MRALSHFGTVARPPYTVTLRDACGAVVGEMDLQEFLARLPEAFVVSTAALSGIDAAAERVREIVATASDPYAPVDVRRGNAVGVFLVDVAMRAAAHARGWRPAPPPPPESETFDAVAEEVTA